MNDILRGRLKSSMNKDMARFVSSMDVDRWIFAPDILVNKAHVMMLCEQNIVIKEDCSSILKALDIIKKEGFSSLDMTHEDVHVAIESKVIKLAGDAGGKMHTAKSRNDEVATCIRIALRGELLEIMHELIALRKSLLNVADKHINTIMPGFTHLQHAQPTTLAHHLIAHTDAFKRDLDRTMDAYSRVNLCPLGAGAFASTGFSINRERTAQLLGFDGLIENSMDAVSTRDFAIECISAFANTMVDLSRMAEELILWNTPEFDFIELDDRYASVSSIMPQKKNPDALELIRARTGSVCGALQSVLSICKALPYSYNRDLQEATPHLISAVSTVRSSLRVMSGIVDTMQVKSDRMAATARVGLITATELADTIVRETGISFRTAHQIVGTLAKSGQKPTLDQIDRIANRIIGKKLSELGLTQASLDKALDPEQNIQIRCIRGGPAPKETLRMAKDRMKQVDSDTKFLDQNVNKIKAALKQMDAPVRER
ncbi:MAG: argininosuccinate lyase [Methanosarcinales archaeon]|nr:MAG: argininosuccinate lyase [Methanosarcinales archaeon]